MRGISLNHALESIRNDLNADAFADALAGLKRVMSVAPLNGEAQFLLGEYFWKRGQIDRARTAMIWAVLCEPMDARAWENLTLIGSVMKATKNWISDYRRAFLAGADAVSLARRVFDVDRISAMRLALCLDPDDAELMGHLALADDAKLGSLDGFHLSGRAETLALTAGSLGLLERLSVIRGRRLQARNRFLDATTALRRAIVLNPGEPERNFDLGRSLLETGNDEQAARVILRVPMIRFVAPGFEYRSTKRLRDRHPSDVSRDHGYSWRELAEGYPVRIEPVGQAGPRIEYKVPATFLARADDAMLLAGHHSIILPSGEVLMEGLTFRQKRRRWDGPCYAYVSDDGGIFATLPEPEPRIDAEAVLLGGGANYYHNVVDWLSRLPTMLEQPGLAELPVLVSRGIPASVVEILEMLGLARERLRFLPAGLFPVKRLWIPSLAHGRLGCVSPRYLEFLEERLFGRFRDPRARGRRRLFVGRRNDGHRQIVNDQALDAVLERYGFEYVTLGDLSAREQFELAADAEILMAPFGAGLTNILACPQTTSVIELTHEQAVRPLFPILAGLRGQRFYRVVGSTARATGRGLPLHANFEIPIDQVEAVIEEVLDGK